MLCLVVCWSRLLVNVTRLSIRENTWGSLHFLNSCKSDDIKV